MSWLWALLAALILGPFAREALRTPVKRLRKGANGQFAALPQGITHYRWQGDTGGPIAVCVHGLTTPSPVWDRVAGGLVAQGYRVLSYDLYGRGLSDRPGGAQDDTFFIRQLSDLLADQGVTGPVTLLGYSMGGAIAPAFAAAHPAQVRELVLIAPAGLGHDLGPASRVIANSGLFGAWLMQLVYARSYRQGCEAERAMPGAVTEIIDLQIAQLGIRGFLPAVRASLRGILDYPLADAHRTIAGVGIPTLAIWGADDEIIPLDGQDILQSYNPDAINVVIPDADHTLTYTATPAVLDALNTHLRRPGS